MDYKYIEQLLERYWECATTTEEERILRHFFAQTDIPAHLLRYKPLFESFAAEAQTVLDDSFDNRVMARIKAQPVTVKAQRISWAYRLRPLYKAAAAVAIVLTLGDAAQYSFGTDGQDDPLLDYSYSDYTDTYTSGKAAYEQASKALHMLTDGARQDVDGDSLKRQVETGAQIME